MSISVVRTLDGWWVLDGRLIRHVDTTAQTTRELLADRPAVDAAVAGRGGEPVAEHLILSPVTAPCRVVAQMVNYRSHATDSGIDPGTVPASFFRKTSGSISGPTDDVVRPAHVRLLDYEVELGLVIGSEVALGTAVTAENLHEVVAGLVVTNDVSARDLQLPKTQFYESKSYPTFTPVGPRLVLVDKAELKRLGDLRLTLTVNNEPRQNQRADDMIVTPADALTLLSRFQLLSPGDLILTGTPGGTALRAPKKVVEIIGNLLPPAKKWELFFSKQAGNPRYLKPGDVVRTSISTDDGLLDLGTQVTTVAEPAAPAATKSTVTVA